MQRNYDYTLAKHEYLRASDSFAMSAYEYPSKMFNKPIKYFMSQDAVSQLEFIVELVDVKNQLELIARFLLTGLKAREKWENSDVLMFVRQNNIKGLFNISPIKSLMIRSRAFETCIGMGGFVNNSGLVTGHYNVMGTFIEQHGHIMQMLKVLGITPKNIMETAAIERWTPNILKRMLYNISQIIQDSGSTIENVEQNERIREIFSYVIKEIREE